ncbi:MAG: hypothetical protein AAF252_10930 [Pseudomonadota bacterium]
MRQLAFTLQIGTRFDGGVPLIWSLMSQPIEGVLVPRPKRYRNQLAYHVANTPNAPVAPADLAEMLGLEEAKGQGDLNCVLRIVKLMEPPPSFCPAGDWFYDIGPRAQAYCTALAPAPVTFMISLCNPAHLLSGAMASGAYPGIDIVTPDPFDLHWSRVLRMVRRSCPDVPIIAWSAEEAPMIWDKVIAAAAGREASFSDQAKMLPAHDLMNEEGSARLADYLEGHAGMPDALRAQVISIFVKRFRREDAVDPATVLPGWDAAMQTRMDRHFAADLREVAGIEGVTLITR